MRYSYCNEVGESFRPLVPVSFVYATYAASGAYVLADTYDKAVKKNNQLLASSSDISTTERRFEVGSSAMDCLLWQSAASVFIPGAVIHTIVKYTKQATTALTQNKLVVRSVPTTVGLAAIPFIIHPIDQGVDFVMDNTTRPFSQYLRSMLFSK